MRVKLAISMLAMLLTASPAMAEVVVIMRREAQSVGKYVRVCDIARIDGPREQAREVAETVLGPAPGLGEVREITRWDIENRLFEMGVAARVAFSGNDMVTVRGHGASAVSAAGATFRQLEPLPGRADPGDSQVLTAGPAAVGADKPLVKPMPRVFAPEAAESPLPAKDALSPEAQKRVGLEITNYFSDRYKSANKKRDDIEIETKIISATGRIPYSAYEMKVAEAEGRLPGKASLRLRVRDTGESPVREITVLADTEVYAKALVAVRNIARAESLSRDDVAVARVRMESGKSYLPPNPASVAGRETKRALKPGDVILAEDAPLGDAVKRGKAVVVRTEGGGWEIRTTAKALGSGAVGDIITVEETGSRNKFPARITGPGTVSAVVRYTPHMVVEKK